MGKQAKIWTLSAVLAALVLPAAAQDSAPTGDANAKPKQTIEQRKENQQQRIGEGVEKGSLTAGEATRLERKEAAINKEEKNMKGDGNFTPAERAKVRHQQNVMSRRIYQQKHDAQARPEAKTEIGARKQAQQQRIGEGIENGSLTAGEAARLEHKEVKLNQQNRAMRAQNGGRLTAEEKAKINRQQNHLSHKIYKQKHDAQHR
jgi:hypothetical protein